MKSSRPSSSKPAAFQSENLHITGGQFNQVHGNSTTNNFAANKGGFERLQEVVATAAFHNSAQRVDAPKCHPNTRKAVMERIMEWIVSRDGRDAWIMWLNGAAGAGKSAIIQSIAELCVKLSIPVASFFFFRTDPTRNNISPLVATLAYQLARIIPASRDFITQAIDEDPLVFQQSLEDQLESLILNPLREIGRLSLSAEIPLPLLVLIDGLDECDDRNVQTNLIRTLSDISANKDIALTFLIASRPEWHLSMAFNARKCTSILTRLALDHEYLPDVDICLFLNDKFAEIQDTHPLKHLLDPAWPPRSVIDDIIEKLSGQFIYASVTMNYVSSPGGHPAHRLEVCRGLRPARADTPFAQLDALYRHIFSQVQDMDATQPVLAMALYGHASPKYQSSLVFDPFLERQERGSLESCLSDLSSVISCSENIVKFLHASLPDFLYDPERAGEYCMDEGTWCAYFALLVFQDPKYSHNLGKSFDFGSFTPSDYPVTHDSEHLVNTDMLTQATPTSELQRELSTFVPIKYLKGRSDQVRLTVLGLLSGVRSMNFNDDGETYRRFFSRLAPYVKTHWPRTYTELKYLAPTLRSRLKSVFPVMMKQWSSSWVRGKKQKDESWGIVEHESYMRATFRNHFTDGSLP